MNQREDLREPEGDAVKRVENKKKDERRREVHIKGALRIRIGVGVGGDMCWGKEGCDLTMI